MILPPSIYSSLKSSADFPGGPSFDLLCQGISIALASWLPLGVSLQGVTTGVIGTGTVQGILVFPVVPGTAALAIASTLHGPTAPLVARALDTGLASALSGCPYAGVSAGVSAGVDVSRVATLDLNSLALALRGTHSSLCEAQGGHGAIVPGFYQALARGIGAILQTGVTASPTGLVSPTGITGLLPSVGTSTSRLV